MMRSHAQRMLLPRLHVDDLALHPQDVHTPLHARQQLNSEFAPLVSATPAAAPSKTTPLQRLAVTMPPQLNSVLSRVDRSLTDRGVLFSLLAVMATFAVVTAVRFGADDYFPILIGLCAIAFLATRTVLNIPQR
jgi:hypothetical protein